MTTTAHWLHLKLGLPLVEHAFEERATEADALCSDADLIALQKAFAASPLAVQFTAC